MCSLLKHPQINNIAENHQASPAQVLIKWAIQRGTAVIPKSVNAERLQQNFDALKINLSSAEMQLIKVLDIHFRFVDGTFWTREEGPYTLENLWDEKV